MIRRRDGLGEVPFGEWDYGSDVAGWTHSLTDAAIYGVAAAAIYFMFLAAFRGPQAQRRRAHIARAKRSLVRARALPRF